jgi:hypothetical protein
LKQEECNNLIRENGLIHNICLVFQKCANLNSVADWSQAEMDIIDTCFSIYEYVSEKELDEYGVAPHVIRALSKAANKLQIGTRDQSLSTNLPVQTTSLLNVAS